MADRRTNPGGSSHQRAVSNLPAKKATQKRGDESQGVVKWLRGIGGGAMLIGTLGLLGDFFWWAIGFVCVGLAILTIDLWMENLRNTIKIAFSLFIGGALVVVALLVLKTSPILTNCSFHPNTGEVVFAISNPSHTDYTNVDFLVRSSERTQFFADINPQSPCISEGPGRIHAVTSPDDLVSLYHPSDHSGTSEQVGNFIRFHCDRLASLSSVSISALAIEPTAWVGIVGDGGVVETNEASAPADAISANIAGITVSGHYERQHRPYEIKLTITPTRIAAPESHSVAPPIPPTTRPRSGAKRGAPASSAPHPSLPFGREAVQQCPTGIPIYSMKNGSAIQDNMGCGIKSATPVCVQMDGHSYIQRNSGGGVCIGSSAPINPPGIPCHHLLLQNVTISGFATGTQSDEGGCIDLDNSKLEGNKQGAVIDSKPQPPK